MQAEIAVNINDSSVSVGEKRMNAKDIFSAVQRGMITAEDAEKALSQLLSEQVATARGDAPVSQFSAREEQGQPEEFSASAVATLSEIEPGIVQVTMEDRVHKNTFSVDLITGLMQVFHTIQHNQSYKVVILTGYESYFACGGSQEGLIALSEGQVKMTDLNLYSLPLACEIPVIAAMQGHAIGGGWCFGLFCDFLVMSRESSYTCNHMRYGFTPGDGATLIFPEKCGYNLAQEILFTGKTYRGAELASRGVPIPILPKSEVLPYALKLAQDLARVPRPSLVLLKAHMTETIRERLSNVLEKEWRMQEQTLVNKPEIMQKMLSAFNRAPDEKEIAKMKLSIQQQPTLPVQPVVASGSKQSPEIILLNRHAQGQPIFWFHGDGGGVEGYQNLARDIPRPWYGLQARGRMNEDEPIRGISAMASYYIELLRAAQPQGSYDLGGYSLGGMLAYEVARQLQEAGQTVRSLVMLDTLDPAARKRVTISTRERILQAVNLSLLNRTRPQTGNVLEKLIHQQDLPGDLSDDELLQHLIHLGTSRGLSLKKTEEELFHIFRKNVQIQQAFEEEQFQLLPLPDPQAVTCYYVRNQKGLYYGALWPYLTEHAGEIGGDDFPYWREWESHLPNFRVIDVDVTSHVTMLFEQKALEAIHSLSQHLYGTDEVDEQ